MQDLDTQIADLRMELEAREAEYKQLGEQKKSLGREIEAIDLQLRAMCRTKISYPSNYLVGVIPNLKAQLKSLTRLKEDMILPLVHFTDGVARDIRVVRVTPKRIYVRETGRENEDYYNLDGTYRYSRSVAIDIARTFPDGLPKTKKAKK